MNRKSEVMINNTSNVWNIINWLFGIAVFAIGVLNMFWGTLRQSRSCARLEGVLTLQAWKPDWVTLSTQHTTDRG